MDANQTINEQLDFLKKILSLLEKVGIPYVITGSVGSSIHGEPRATRDIDIIIAPNVIQMKNFVNEVAPSFYVSLEAALNALHHTGMFNIIDGYTGNKADLIIPAKTPFERQKFLRRSRTTYQGLDIFIATAEDIIISKLVWHKETGSEKQIQDAAGIVSVQQEQLDREYLRKWAKELEVSDELEVILTKADDVNGRNQA